MLCSARPEAVEVMFLSQIAFSILLSANVFLLLNKNNNKVDGGFVFLKKMEHFKYQAQ